LTFERPENPWGEIGMPEERATVETVKEARQGVTGHNARVVLIVSCALAIVAMGIVFLLVGGWEFFYSLGGAAPGTVTECCPPNIGEKIFTELEMGSGASAPKYDKICAIAFVP
jgi:hypothetical protein